LKNDPFKDKTEKTLVLINDTCVLLCSSLLFGFYFASEFSMYRIVLAWIFVCFVLFTVFLNIAISMGVSIKAFCAKLREKREKKLKLRKYDYSMDPDKSKRELND